MTRVGIVGAGRAAVLHAEAARASTALSLTAVAARPSSSRAASLVAALGCDASTVAQLGDMCDVAVVATPPAARLEVMSELAGSSRLRAVMVESPAAVTLEQLDAIAEVMADTPVIVAANLLHAPAVRSTLRSIAAMHSHHLVLQAAVPEPDRDAAAGDGFGGGVLMDPAAGLWPLLLTALGAELASVTALRISTLEGVDQYAEVLLQDSKGAQAGAVFGWGAEVAQGALEAADPDHVARVDLWPTPTAEFDGAAVHGAAVHGAGHQAHPLAALGFVAQLERLSLIAKGEAALWPDLSVASAALTTSVAAALSTRCQNEPVCVTDVPRDASVFEILNRGA